MHVLTIALRVTTLPFRSFPLSSCTALSASSRERYSMNLTDDEIKHRYFQAKWKSWPSSAVLLIDVAVSDYSSGKTAEIFQFLSNDVRSPMSHYTIIGSLTCQHVARLKLCTVTGNRILGCSGLDRVYWLHGFKGGFGSEPKLHTCSCFSPYGGWDSCRICFHRRFSVGDFVRAAL